MTSPSPEDSTTTARAVAAALLAIDGVRFQPGAPLTFKSGLRSPVYCDNRRFPFWPRHWRTVLEGFAGLVVGFGAGAGAGAEPGTAQRAPEIVAGLESAGIPHSAALGYTLGLPSVFVRKAAKEHGTRKRVEGGDVTGRRVLLIEDLVTTGGSSLSGVEALRAEGAIVTDCLAIITYGFPATLDHFAAAGVCLHTLTDFPTVLDLALHNGTLGPADAESVRRWLRDPAAWQATADDGAGLP